jgi:hypothetical protein
MAPTTKKAPPPTAVLLGDDMCDVEGQEIGVALVQLAVFTATACPLPDEGPSGEDKGQRWFAVADNGNHCSRRL